MQVPGGIRKRDTNTGTGKDRGKPWMDRSPAPFFDTLEAMPNPYRERASPVADFLPVRSCSHFSDLLVTFVLLTSLCIFK